jgi:hypothetical protein
MKARRLNLDKKSLDNIMQILLVHEINVDVFFKADLEIKSIKKEKTKYFSSPFNKKNNLLFAFYKDIKFVIYNNGKFNSISSISIPRFAKKIDDLPKCSKVIQNIENLPIISLKNSNLLNNLMKMEFHFSYLEKYGIINVELIYSYLKNEINSLTISSFYFDLLNYPTFRYKSNDTTINFEKREIQSWFIDKYRLIYNLQDDFEFLKTYNCSLLEILDY